MIKVDDVKKLADLARIEISSEELKNLTTEVDSILGYVGQVTNTEFELKREIPKLRNVMREDAEQNSPKEYTEDILKNAPSTEGKYVKVKKILGNSDNVI